MPTNDKYLERLVGYISNAQFDKIFREKELRDFYNFLIEQATSTTNSTR